MQIKSVHDDRDDSQVPSQQMSEGSRKVELLPGMQFPVGVVYTPTSRTVSLSALDISDLLHSKKYRVNHIFNYMEQVWYNVYSPSSSVKVCCTIDLEIFV